MRALLVLLAGCANELEPGDIGYVDCDAYPLGQNQIQCDPVEICCEQTGPSDTLCSIVREDTYTYTCAGELDCGAAVTEAICDVCDVDRDLMDCDRDGQTGVRP